MREDLRQFEPGFRKWAEFKLALDEAAFELEREELREAAWELDLWVLSEELNGRLPKGAGQEDRRILRALRKAEKDLLAERTRDGRKARSGRALEKLQRRGRGMRMR